MPKKLGTNPKAAEARERKATEKKAANDKAARAAEDRLWADDDKGLAKKQNRKEEEERKRAEQLRRKTEAKQLLEQESASLKVAPKQSIHKITQAQIKEETERRNKAIETINKANAKPVCFEIRCSSMDSTFSCGLILLLCRRYTGCYEGRRTTIGREFESRACRYYVCDWYRRCHHRSEVCQFTYKFPFEFFCVYTIV